MTTETKPRTLEQIVRDTYSATGLHGEKWTVVEAAIMEAASRASPEAPSVEAGFLLDAVAQALDGKEVSDFALSFPVVAEAADLHSRLAAAECMRDDRIACVHMLEKEIAELRRASPKVDLRGLPTLREIAAKATAYAENMESEDGLRNALHIIAANVNDHDCRRASGRASPEEGRLREETRVLRLALEGMVDAHTDKCRDDRDEICCSCAMAITALEDRALRSPPAPTADLCTGGCGRPAVEDGICDECSAAGRARSRPPAPTETREDYDRSLHSNPDAAAWAKEFASAQKTAREQFGVGFEAGAAQFRDVLRDVLDVASTHPDIGATMRSALDRASDLLRSPPPEDSGAREARLEAAIRWALGETDFRPRAEGEGPYWWRKELHRLAFGAPASSKEGGR